MVGWVQKFTCALGEGPVLLWGHLCLWTVCLGSPHEGGLPLRKGAQGLGWRAAGSGSSSPKARSRGPTSLRPGLGSGSAAQQLCGHSGSPSLSEHQVAQLQNRLPHMVQSG